MSISRSVAGLVACLLVVAACGVSSQRLAAPTPVSPVLRTPTAAISAPAVLPTPTPSEPPQPASPSPSTSASARTAQPTTSAPASPTPAFRGILPAELLIPAIHVDAPIEHVGITPDGEMDLPKQWNDVAWYEPGYKPGDAGSAVIVGHLDSTTDRAVFWDLRRLKTGDAVVVKGSDGAERTFAVGELNSYPYNQAPLQRIFGPAAEPMLNLVTCNGRWDRATKNYDQRLVVYTQLRR